MKILIFSDSHRSIGGMYDAIEKENPDYVIHLGDHLHDAEDIACAFQTLAILYVPGNCDYAISTPATIVREFGGVRILATHGHLFGVKSSLQRLTAEAKACSADIALFGHTHVALCQQQDDLWLLNPGSCGTVSRNPSYGVILIENGKPVCEIRNIDD